VPINIDVELLALDLNRCARCVGTMDHIEKAIKIIRPVLEVVLACPQVWNHFLC
jgi:hypothetical protein